MPFIELNLNNRFSSIGTHTQNDNLFSHIQIYFILPFSQERSNTSSVTDESNDENVGPNEDANVTKQFKLRNKRVEFKDGTTKKFILDTVQFQTPKRARTVKRKPSVAPNVAAGPSGSSQKRRKVVAKDDNSVKVSRN